MEGIGVGIAGLAMALAVSGCYAETDAESYSAGDLGTVTFVNDSPMTSYLGGCNAFDQEQLEGDTWVSRGGDVVCVWEGIAQSVAPKSELELPFEARSAGTWRLHFDVGLVCEADEPLSRENCGPLLDVYSNEFAVDQETCELGHFAACQPGDLCIRSRADCCGCEMGGTEVAINAAHEDEWIDQLRCAPGTICLAVYMCSGRVPRCVDGCCDLVGP